MQLLHAHSRFLKAGILAASIKKEFGIPYILTEHSSFYALRLRGIIQGGKLKFPGVEKYIQRMYAAASKVVFVSHHLAGLVSRLPGIELQDYRVIPNILNEQYLNTPYSPPPTTLQPFQLCTIGRLDTNKNQQLQLQAIAILLQKEIAVRLKIIGAGKQKKLLQQKAEALGVSQYVCFLGEQPVNQVIKVLDDSHALLSTSHYETFGVVIIEALARGRPVIATRSGGADALVPSEYGQLVESNAEELAQAIADSISAYHHFNHFAIHQKTLNNFGPQTISDRLIRLYQNTKSR